MAKAVTANRFPTKLLELPTALLLGLALITSTLAVGASPGAAYAQDGPADGGYRPEGAPLPAVEFDPDDSPEELAEDDPERFSEAQAVDPGRYRVTLPPTIDQGVLTVVEKEPASSLWVTLVLRLPSDQEYSDEVSVMVHTPSGDECASEEINPASEDDIYTGPAPIGILVDPGTIEDSDDRAACMQADQLLVRMAHDPDDEAREIPAELLMIEEPSVIGADQLPEQADDPDDFEPSWASSDTDPDRAEGAPTFADAPRLSPGRYTDTLATGETRIYRLDVGWGQYAQATANVARLSAGEAAQLDDQELPFRMFLLGPNLNPVAGAAEAVDAESDTVLGARSTGVRYRNREDSSETFGATALAGPYYLVVNLPTSAELPNLSLSYELDLRVRGANTGAPDYTGPAAPPDGLDGLVTSDARSETDEPDQATGDGKAAADPGWWPTLGPVLVGIAAATLAVFVGLLLLRRRAGRG